MLRKVHSEVQINTDDAEKEVEVEEVDDVDELLYPQDLRFSINNPYARFSLAPDQMRQTVMQLKEVGRVRQPSIDEEEEIEDVEQSVMPQHKAKIPDPALLL